jgi:hypothetical protein
VYLQSKLLENAVAFCRLLWLSLEVVSVYNDLVASLAWK